MGGSSIVFSASECCLKQHVTSHKTTRCFHQNDTLFSPKRYVVFLKTIRCFYQNDMLFSPKRYVVFFKTIRCFSQNDTSIDEHETSIMGRPMQDEYELGSFAEFPKGNSRGSCNIERIHLMRHWDAHHKVSFGNGLRRKAVALGTHDER